MSVQCCVYICILSAPSRLVTLIGFLGARGKDKLPRVVLLSGCVCWHILHHTKGSSSIAGMHAQYAAPSMFYGQAHCLATNFI